MLAPPQRRPWPAQQPHELAAPQGPPRAEQVHPASVGGESVLLGSEDNVAAVAMFLGKSAPLPPPKGLPYAPGCVIGDRAL